MKQFDQTSRYVLAFHHLKKCEVESNMSPSRNFILDHRKTLINIYNYRFYFILRKLNVTWYFEVSIEEDFLFHQSILASWSIKPNILYQQFFFLSFYTHVNFFLLSSYPFHFAWWLQSLVFKYHFLISQITSYSRRNFFLFIQKT